MAGTFAPLSAKNAKVRINGVTFVARKWMVNARADKIDTTNFECGGYAELITGIISAEVSIEAHWNRNQNPYDNPPSLAAATELTNVRLYINDTTGPYWYFPLLVLLESPTTADVRGAVEFSCRGEGNGTFTAPTGVA